MDEKGRGHVRGAFQPLRLLSHYDSHAPARFQQSATRRQLADDCQYRRRAGVVVDEPEFSMDGWAHRLVLSAHPLHGRVILPAYRNSVA